MKSSARKLIAVCLTIFIVISACSLSALALTFSVGGTLGSGTITSATNRTVAAGVTYSTAVYTDSSSDSQKVQALSFNPKTSNFIPYVYSKYSGYGATTINSATDAESKYGLNIVGGINASFFSFVGTCCNTYGGVNISDGKIIQGCNSNGATYMLVFDSAGNSDLVYSRVSYALSMNGSPWSGALENINMYPYTLGTGIYYYDTSCGNNTDTNAAGVEVVFNKINNTELTVGGTLKGTVAQIRSNVSSGGSIGFNQFVLYASNSSPWAASLRALAVGNTAEITVTETIAAAKTKMENASSALVTYGYHIVSNGVNVTSSNGLGSSFNNESAQRSAVGIKSDGTLIIVATQGRTTTYPGLTVYELADMLIGLGCVTAVLLDGGGSTQMTVENSSGTLEAVFSSTRRVANSLLITQRPTISSTTRSTLFSLISSANAYLSNYTLSSASQTAMQAALNYGNSVYNAATSMPGDYTKAIMRLQKAIAEVVITGYNTGIYQSTSSLVMRSSASSGAGTVTTIPANTSLSVTSVSGDYGYTKYMSYTGWIYIPSCTRIANLSTAAAVISSVDERPANASLTVTWNSVPGAAGYIYKIIQLAGAPDPGNENESLNSVQLAYAENTRATSVTVPAASMTNGKYIKVAIGVVYPTTTVWSTKYIIGSELPFTDVPTTAWYYTPVKYVYNAGLFSGTSGTTFSPDTTMTRGMMVTVLYRLAGQPAVSGTLTFTDVATGSYYYNAVLWATQNGIASGYSSTTFGPDDNVQRQQAIIFIYRYASMAGCDMSITPGFTLTGYSDYSSIASYAVTAMTWAVNKGIISGNGNQLFPAENATRAQLASMLYNFNSILP
jgi:exopolysaccharide biosynthesis protein